MSYPRTESHSRVSEAVRRNRALSREGLLERLFERLFHGLVYAQIWEDPEIDLQALALNDECHVVAIASGGCNVLSYLIDDPGRITALDLSPAHVALVKLKLAAVKHLPNWQTFHRFVGGAHDKANIATYFDELSFNLDPETRAYWEQRSLQQLGRRRISIFARNAYRHGVLGRFIGLSHAFARLHGVKLRDLLSARTLEEQRRYFETVLAPLFDRRLVRWVTANRLSLYGLGIPPAQYEALAGGSEICHVLRDRVERLTCGFDLSENYFAWQAFGRAYPEPGRGPMPPYLRQENHAVVRRRAGRIEVMNRSITEYLSTCSAVSRDRYVLLDAQDWMTDAQLNALWREITRTARPSARVIFRTAAKASLLPGRLAPELLDRWHYESEQSRALGDRDRSAIYGGFHLYVLKA